MVETAKALICFDAIVAGESGGGKEIEGGKWRRCLETGDSEKSKNTKRNTNL